MDNEQKIQNAKKILLRVRISIFLLLFWSIILFLVAMYDKTLALSVVITFIMLGIYILIRNLEYLCKRCKEIIAS